MKIITNNPEVLNRISNIKIEYYDTSYRDILEIVRDEIVIARHILLSHPLSGSVKPNETYYKSILVDEKDNGFIDLNSLDYMDSSLSVYDKFIEGKKRPDWTKKVLHDFATVDYYLILGAVESANIN